MKQLQPGDTYEAYPLDMKVLVYFNPNEVSVFLMYTSQSTFTVVDAPGLETPKSFFGDAAFRKYLKETIV